MIRIEIKGRKRAYGIVRQVMGNSDPEASRRDVTVVCGGHELHLHQAVLRAFSPYFSRMLERIELPHPVIMLSVPYEHMQAIIEVIYQRSALIPFEHLHAVQQAARSLQIRGIHPVPQSPTTTPPPVYDDGQRPGPSGLGKAKAQCAVVSSTVGPQLPGLVRMLDNASLFDDAPPQDEPEQCMESEFSGELQCAILDSTEDVEQVAGPAPEDSVQQQAEYGRAQEMDIDMPDGSGIRMQPS